MSTQPISSFNPVRQPGTYAALALFFDLEAEVRLLENEKPWQAAHTAKTLVKHPDLRVVLVALRAGARLHQHETGARVSIQTLSGFINVRVPGTVTELPAGHLVALERDVPHEVVAQCDSAFLLTIAWPAQGPLRQHISKAAEPLVFAAAPQLASSAKIISIADDARERGLDKTLADTFPCSDAFSSIPDPSLEIA